LEEKEYQQALAAQQSRHAMEAGKLHARRMREVEALQKKLQVPVLDQCEVVVAESTALLFLFSKHAKMYKLDARDVSLRLQASFAW